MRVAFYQFSLKIKDKVRFRKVPPREKFVLEKKRLEKSTELPKRVWEHKNKGQDYQIQWSVIKKTAPYRCGARIRSLCLAEKLQIIKAKPEGLLNKRSQLISKCRHKKNFAKNVD